MRAEKKEDSRMAVKGASLARSDRSERRSVPLGETLSSSGSKIHVKYEADARARTRAFVLSSVRFCREQKGSLLSSPKTASKLHLLKG